jgi:hypothetical protein
VGRTGTCSGYKAGYVTGIKRRHAMGEKSKKDKDKSQKQKAKKKEQKAKKKQDKQQRKNQ